MESFLVQKNKKALKHKKILKFYFFLFISKKTLKVNEIIRNFLISYTLKEKN